MSSPCAATGQWGARLQQRRRATSAERRRQRREPHAELARTVNCFHLSQLCRPGPQGWSRGPFSAPASLRSRQRGGPGRLPRALAAGMDPAPDGLISAATGRSRRRGGARRAQGFGKGGCRFRAPRPRGPVFPSALRPLGPPGPGHPPFPLPSWATQRISESKWGKRVSGRPSLSQLASGHVRK